MERISFRLVCLWGFIFSLSLSGCVPDDPVTAQVVKSEGYRLYAAKCSACHRLLPPERYSIEKFQEYIDKYGKEMTSEEKESLLGALKEYKSKKGEN